MRIPLSTTTYLCTLLALAACGPPAAAPAEQGALAMMVGDSDTDGDTDGDTDDSTRYDQDADGFCAHASGCLDGSTPGDCDDTEQDVFPDAPELCDGLVNDCNASGSVADTTSVPAEPDIADGRNGTSNPSTTLFEMYVANDMVITDLNMTLDIDHTYLQDLIITLTSPAGTSAVLFNRHGGSSNNLDSTVFDDEADEDVSSGSAPFAGSYRPDQALSAFDGESSAGTWILSVQDTFSQDTGTVNSWTLSVEGAEIDADLDGALSCAGDCDDSDPAILPTALEIADGIDNNCDGVLFDGDQDGSSWLDDCDDNDANRFPGATETCNGLDDDCDGELLDDELDGDADGVLTCADCAPEDPLYGDTCPDADADGVLYPEDCNDSDPDAFPGAPELCNGNDDDCDGVVPDDELDGDADGVLTCADCAPEDPLYGDTCPDADADGVLYPEDCDDSDPNAFPGAPELCNGLDDDCDGVVPDDELDGDADGVSACDGDCAPEDPTYLDTCPDADGDGSFVPDDCDDDDITIFAGQVDVCNGIDEDCDGEIDEDCNGVFLVQGADSFVVSTTLRSWSDARDYCLSINGDLASFEDADQYDAVAADARAASNDSFWIGYNDIEEEGTWVWSDGTPSSFEDWNSNEPNDAGGEDCAVIRDNNALNWNDADCDGSRRAVCEVGCSDWYVDLDGDGDGVGDAVSFGCGEPPPGFAPSGDDCDDADPLRFTGNEELCDGIDNDCDGLLLPAGEVDGDADSFLSCDDCDDADPAIFPGAAEVLDGVDSDCDGLDFDADGDGSESVDDCDDSDDSIYPGAPETEDGIDSDCDGLDLDADADGSDVSEDCDDSDPAISPILADCPGETDSDCDGSCDSVDLCIGDDTTGDVDADGYCASDLVGDVADCDDAEPTANTGAAEICGDGIDNDCDGRKFAREYALAVTGNDFDHNASLFETIEVADHMEITDLDVQLDITHTFTSDLEITLTSPSGTDVRLIFDEGGSGNNLIATVFDDEAGTSITNGSPPFTGSFRPEDALSDFDGEDAQGAWVLEIHDDAGGDNGTLDGFILSFEAEDDLDGDGAFSCTECNDFDASSFPGAVDAEIDGIDQDCDGLDFDGDGDGWDHDEDCDDDDAAVNPAATMCTDDIDSDCDGVCDASDVCIGDDASADADLDGHCALDITGVALDCDDADPAIHPDAAETCDGVDQDCDGEAAAAVVAEASDLSLTLPAAVDGELSTLEATLAVDAVTTIADLDLSIDLDLADANAIGITLTSPMGTTVEVLPQDYLTAQNIGHQWLDVVTFDDEAIRVISNDEVPLSGVLTATGDLSAFDGESPLGTWTLVLSSSADEASTLSAWSLELTAEETDADADGFLACEDCDDDEATAYPGAAEDLFDFVDNDCDGIDLDADNDGYLLFDDCDDNDASVNPGATEDCTDGVDTDCDGTLPFDEYDFDGDGHATCAGDCDDLDATRYPGAEELCDDVDNDCDGELGADELDGDVDGVTVCAGDCVGDDPNYTLTCPDYDGDGELYDSDCDDDNAAINSAAASDSCNSVDDDCDGEVDEDCACVYSTDGSTDTLTCDEAVADATAACEAYGGTVASHDPLTGYTCEIPCGSWYTDDDGDGVGIGDALYTGCGLPPAGAAAIDGDCNDADATIDAGCDAYDFDGDGFCLADTCADGSLSGDCDDDDADRYPGAPEICDGLDNDCDGAVPDSEAGGDVDGDLVCDADDVCDGDDAVGDTDGDGVCDDLDTCPLDSPDDADGDGLCDSDPADICFGLDVVGDADGDEICDYLDLCDGDDATGDNDGDGVCDDIDVCEGADAAGDLDGDGVCTDVDVCPLDAADDSDGDGVCDSVDLCDGDDASGDSDGDGLCDDSELCEGDSTLGDSDGDGFCDLLLEVTPGATHTFEVSGARAGSRVYILYSALGEGGNFCHPTIDICADLRQPTIGPNERVDDDGEAILTLDVTGLPPEARTFRAVWIDNAAQEGETSNAVAIGAPPTP